MTKLAIGSIISAIHEMDRDELNEVVEAVKYARAQGHRQATRSLSIGDVVQFDGKYGRTFKGTVKKINIKYVVINCGVDGNWRVPAGHLTQVKAA